MHSRNRYKHTKPDFGELGEFYPSLKPHLIQRHHGGAGGRSSTFTLDFSNPEALRELTCAILARDFGIKLEIPLDKLIPAVPQRLNYVHWIEDLLSDGEAGAHPTGEEVTGIDIGVWTEEAERLRGEGERWGEGSCSRTAAFKDALGNWSPARREAFC